MGNDIFNKLIAKKGLWVEQNKLNLFKSIDFSMYPANAFAIILQKLSLDKNKKYLGKLGSIMGEKASEEFKEEIKKISSFLSKDYQEINNIILLSGFGEVFIEEKKGAFKVINKWHPVISKAKELYSDKSNVCEFYGEVYASFVKKYKNLENLKVYHKKCVCNGDEFCEWELKNGKTNKSNS